MPTCAVCCALAKTENSLSVHGSTKHRGTPSSVYAPHRQKGWTLEKTRKIVKPASKPRREEQAYVPQSGGGKAGKAVTSATALPTGYVGAYWTTFSPSLGTVFHFYE